MDKKLLKEGYSCREKMNLYCPNPSTKIKYQLTKPSKIKLKIYNLAGQEITTLVNEFQPAGEYEITWQPKG